MEIKNEYELNALNKLLSKIKFQDDLDFYEFREFAASPLIADIFQRVSDEIYPIFLKKGFVKDKDYRKFSFDSRTGDVLKKRIDELTEKERMTLKSNNTIDEYLKILLVPLDVPEEEFEKLREYFNSAE